MATRVNSAATPVAGMATPVDSVVGMVVTPVDLVTPDTCIFKDNTSRVEVTATSVDAVVAVTTCRFNSNQGNTCTLTSSRKGNTCRLSNKDNTWW